MADLFSPVRMGALALKNRITMSPMTRDRATDDRIPTPMMATYYAQRASAGLIVTEGTSPHPKGRSYLRAPGLYNQEQVAAWRQVTDAVHAAGGLIVVQLMHAGRISHPSFLDGEQPISASAVKPAGDIFTTTGKQPYPTPREMTEAEIDEAIAGFGQAAALSAEAGFDGAELHLTSGYLPVQFLLPTINRRTDRWGGGVEARARFALAALDAMVAARGADRVGVKIGPLFTYNDAQDPDPKGTYTHLVPEISKRGIAYLEMIDLPNDWNALETLRPLFDGPFIANGGYDRARADAVLAAGKADAVSFGSLFLANPDLPARLKRNGPYNKPDPSTFYDGGEKGYTDYPTLD